MSRNYTEAEVRNALTSADIVSSKLFELMPEIIRTNDPRSAIKGFLGAVQDEYNRNKDSVMEVMTLVDPLGVNNRFILEGNPTFYHPDQLVPISDAGNSPSPYVEFNGNPPGVSGDDFYNGFAIHIIEDLSKPGTVGLYRRIIDYDGTTRKATLDADWPTGLVPSATAVAAMCWPDRVWLPTEVVGNPRHIDGTVLPSQTAMGANWLNSEIALPRLFYISDEDDFYNGWQLTFLDGNNVGVRFTITDFDGTTSIATVNPAPAAEPLLSDWFKLTPPKSARVSPTDNFYKDRYLRILSGTSDTTNGYQFTTETRRIIRSEYDEFAIPASHICYIADDATGEGERWDFPPDPNSYFGITNHYVSLAYLARQVGWKLDSLDAEELQREQVRQAFNFYKLKGTKRAMELIIRSFGLVPLIQEQGSNYTRPPDPVETGPGTSSPAHTQYPWARVERRIEDGMGEDSVPCSFTAVPDSVVIPDSDIKIYVSRSGPKTPFDSTILERILDKIEDVRPVHVEILLVGFLQQQDEDLDVGEDLQFEGTYFIDETIGVSEGFAGSPTGTVVVPLEVEDPLLEEKLLIISEARYDVTESRYDGAPTQTSRTHYDVGTVHE